MKSLYLPGYGRALAVAVAVGALAARPAVAAPLKVACIGEHTTHSDHFPATNRETQPVGMQEYPAMLQTLLGSAYEVINFGDCCATVLQGYSGGENHPYVSGSLPGHGPGYNESLTFLPDIVVIGSWGGHDWGVERQSQTPKFTLTQFQTDYDDLVQRYMKLSSHPRIFVSLPIPIQNGQGDVADNGVTTSSVLPAVKAVAAKYNLTVIDTYTPFLGHNELFDVGDGEHLTTTDGFKKLADTVYAALTAALTGADGGALGDAATSDAAAASDGGQAGATGGGAGGTGGDEGGGAGSGGAAGVEGVEGGAVGTATGAGGSTGAGGAAGGTHVTPGSSSSGCSCASGDAEPGGHALVSLCVAAVAGVMARSRRKGRATRLGSH